MAVADCKAGPSLSRSERKPNVMNAEPLRDASSEGAAQAPPPAASLVISVPAPRSLDGAVDTGDFERRLMTLALSPESGGASRAWLLRRVPGGRLAVACESPAGARTDDLDPHECGEAVRSAWRDATAAWSRSSSRAAPWSEAVAVGALAYRLDRDPGSLLVVAWDREPGTEAEARFLDMARLAHQAARARAAREGWRRSSERRGALVEWLRAAAGSHHLSEGLRACGRAALRVSDARWVALWTCGPEGVPRLAHTAGEAGDRESQARALQGLAEEVFAGRGPARIEGEELAARVPAIGASACVRMLPLVASGRVLGVLAAVVPVDAAGVSAAGAPADSVREDDEGIEDLMAVADGLAVLLDRAARSDAERAGEQKVRELRARLRRREWLATVGERAASALGEARHPMASIGAFARRAHRELDEGDPRREYLEVILRESERLERLIAESAEPLEPEPSRLRMETLNAVLQEVLPGIGEKLVRRRVRLLKRLDPDSPALLLDSERVRQVFRNILDRAVESVPVGGRVRVESRLVRDHVIAEIAFDGGRSPGDLLEELFVPFTPEAAHGAPGLGVADRIVRDHGGEVRVRADGEWGAAVIVTLPVRGNEERRRARADRRLIRSDRRLPAGPA